MKKRIINDFGIVDSDGDTFEFHYNKGTGAVCTLEAVIQTERGPKRIEYSTTPVFIWRKVSVRAVRELLYGMGEDERSRKVPKLKIGTNRLSPMLGRELAVLLWALMEEGATDNIEAILQGWRELAREERWWLFSKASSHNQKTGVGWRRALFYALSEPIDTRTSRIDLAEKKSPSKLLTKHSSLELHVREPIRTLKNSVKQTSQNNKKRKNGARGKSKKDKNDKNGRKSHKQMELF